MALDDSQSSNHQPCRETSRKCKEPMEGAFLSGEAKKRKPARIAKRRNAIDSKEPVTGRSDTEEIENDENNPHSSKELFHQKHANNNLIFN